MKAKINIELWDDSTSKDIEEAGVTAKFLAMCYKMGYEAYTGGICADGMQYKVSVEVVDNTVE